jgi:hypothetical protein
MSPARTQHAMGSNANIYLKRILIVTLPRKTITLDSFLEYPTLFTLTHVMSKIWTYGIKEPLYSRWYRHWVRRELQQHLPTSLVDYELMSCLPKPRFWTPPYTFHVDWILPILISWPVLILGTIVLNPYFFAMMILLNRKQGQGSYAISGIQLGLHFYYYYVSQRWLIAVLCIRALNEYLFSILVLEVSNTLACWPALVYVIFLWDPIPHWLWYTMVLISVGWTLLNVITDWEDHFGFARIQAQLNHFRATILLAQRAHSELNLSAPSATEHVGPQDTGPQTH